MQLNTLKNSRGFTLVEVLVAVVILSIGLLAVAGMQTTSLRGGNNALYRSQAVLGAEDILDRMRANRVLALIQNPKTTNYPVSYDVALNVRPDDNPPGVKTGMAFDDLMEWKDSLAVNLPGGDGSVDLVGGIVTVTVEWTDSFGTEQVEMVTRL